MDYLLARFSFSFFLPLESFHPGKESESNPSAPAAQFLFFLSWEVLMVDVRVLQCIVVIAKIYPCLAPLGTFIVKCLQRETLLRLLP